MEIGYRLSLPPGFLKKEVNEPVVWAMLRSACGFGEGRHGNPPEPDYMAAEDLGIEVTFAAGSDHKELFLREFCDGIYRPGAESAALRARPIFAALARKAKKTYSTPRTALAILCMLELFDWADKDCPARERVLERIRGGYIAPGPFTTVYLLVPGLAGEWYCYDVAARQRRQLLVLDHLQAPYYRAAWVRED